MRTWIACLVIAFIVGSRCASALADGGQVRASNRNGEYQVTVFTSPNPLRAGPVDVSVLVQDAETGAAISDASVVVELTPADSGSPPIRSVATTVAATNKLLSAALVDLPDAGPWEVRVSIEPPGASAFASTFKLDVAPPLPAWLAVWPWFMWPFVVVIFFAIHRGLMARRSAHHASPHRRIWGTA